ncbi:MAG: MFS transporter [Bacteroidetes bacterium]|nr:MFS transporter [Bacteroidota bacterium]MBU1719898.1 MFS transporter [Bacteroidota bacterium]
MPGILKIRDFRFFLLFRFLMTMAVMMQSVIVGWQLYDITHDPLDLGMIGLTEAIPQISIALFAGHLADLRDRRTLIAVNSSLFLFGVVLLSLYSVDSIGLREMFGTLPIYIVIFSTGIVRGMLHPSVAALMPQLVPRELYPKSASWSSAVWHSAAVAGPAIGGLIYGFVGVTAAYLTICGLVLLAVIMMLSIKKRPRVQNLLKEGMFDRIKTGFRFVKGHQIILGAMALDMFAVLFGGAVALLPVFASDVLNAGPEGLGFLRACPAAGAVLMSAYLTWRPPVRKTGVLLLSSVAGFGLCIVLFALSRNLWLSAALLFCSGLFDNISVVIRSTIMQIYTPDELRGRVAAINSIFIGSSNEIGSFESGVTAKLFGLVPAVIFGGGMTLLVVAFAAVKAPVLRRLEFQVDNTKQEV